MLAVDHPYRLAHKARVRPERYRLAETSIRPTHYLAQKVYLDLALAFVLLVPALPCIALLLLLVRLTSPGPALLRQVRVGLNGQFFVMYKIRTMRIDAEASTGAVWAQGNDPRVTRLGRFLRRSHLDELPQLFNVLRLEMSMVGPRPERPEFVGKLAKTIPLYCDRLLVRPGITGLAQVKLPPDSDMSSVTEKLELDREYIPSASLFLDCCLMLYTAGRFVQLPEKMLLRLTCLDHPRYAKRAYFRELMPTMAGQTPI